MNMRLAAWGSKGMYPTSSTTSSAIRCSLSSSLSRRPWRWASASSATHSVAVRNATRWPARHARIPSAIARRLLCLSRADAESPGSATRRGRGRERSGGFEDSEEASRDVALEAALDLARRPPFGGAAGGVGAGGGGVLEAGGGGW